MAHTQESIAAESLGVTLDLFEKNVAGGMTPEAAIAAAMERVRSVAPDVVEHLVAVLTTPKAV